MLLSANVSGYRVTVENSGGLRQQVVLGTGIESAVVVRAVVIDGQRQQVGPQPLGVSVGQLEPTVSEVVGRWSRSPIRHGVQRTVCTS